MKIEVDRKMFLEDLNTVYHRRMARHSAYERLRELCGPSAGEVRDALRDAGLNDTLGWSDGAWYSGRHPALKVVGSGSNALSNLKYLRNKIDGVIKEFEG